MFKLDNAFLEELGLGTLPAVEKNKMLAHIYETLEMRVGMKLAEQMSNEQLDEFESYINAQDEAGALKWLESNFPNYKEVVAQELEKLKSEISQVAPQIVAQSEANAAQAPQQPQVAQQPAAPQMQQPVSQPQAPQQPQQPPADQNPQPQQPIATPQVQPPTQQQPPQAYGQPTPPQSPMPAAPAQQPLQDQPFEQPSAYPPQQGQEPQVPQQQPYQPYQPPTNQ